MSLLLTKTCEYAILITLQEGRYFPKEEFDNSYSVQIETELDLKLPPSINDLIPRKTTIASPIVQVDSEGHFSFNLSLVYFVTFKQLERLRKNNAYLTLTINKMQDGQSNGNHLGRVLMSLSSAKEVVPQSAHHLDHIYKFVLDKGAWCKVQSKGSQQLKAGLFYVAMPDGSNMNINSSNGRGSSASNYTIPNTPSIQLRSPSPTLSIAAPALPPAQAPPSNKQRPTSISSSRKKKIATNILGTSSYGANTISTSSNSKESLSKRIPLRRAKSSVVDLDIDELADVLKNIDLIPSGGGGKGAGPSLPPLPSAPSTTAPENPPPTLTPHHQIGNGTSEFTFYFRIVNVDNMHQILRTSKTSTRTLPAPLKKPFFSYIFLRQHNLVPAASFSLSKQQQHYSPSIRTCFHLRGHLKDIQAWLDSQKHITLNYVLMEGYKREIAGYTKVHLQGIAFDYKRKNGIPDKLYSVIEKDTSTSEGTGKDIAKVTVRIGLLHGWHHADLDEILDTRVDIRKSHTASNDPWEFYSMNGGSLHKKMRHHSESSVPTLLTSSTTSSNSCSTSHNNTSTSVTAQPSIYYVDHLKSKKVVLNHSGRVTATSTATEKRPSLKKFNDYYLSTMEGKK